MHEISVNFITIPCIQFPGEDIVCSGTLEYYDKGYDRVNVKHEKPLQRIDRIFHTVGNFLHKFYDACPNFIIILLMLLP